MSGERGSVAWLGHATTMIEVDGVKVLTDPLLHGRAAHLRRIAPATGGPLHGIDAVLVSHVHWDHLDLRSLDRVGRTVRVVVPPGAAGVLERRGFTNVVELAEGEQLALGDVTVRATHAEHRAGRGPFGVRAPALGYLVSGSRSVYFAGDTDRFEEMAELAHGLDVALLPVAGWGSRVPAGHLDPVRAADCLPLLRPRIAVPIHWGTFTPFYRRRVFAPEAGEQFAVCARLVAPAVDVRVLQVGDATAF